MPKNTDAYFPAGQENIDNIPDEINDTGVIDEAAVIDTLNLDQLGELYEQYLYKKDDVEAALTEIKKTIFEKMDTDSQKVGNFNAFIARTAKFPDLTIERARDLGLTKVEEKIDTTLCKKAHQNGTDLGKVEWEEKWVMRKITEEQPE